MPGCKDTIIENQTGLFCKTKDAESLAFQIEKLILDKDLRNSIGRKRV